MRIRQLLWSNFRRIPDGGIRVRNHLVLVGPNDSGKSSVLRALQMCLGMSHGQLTATITPRDFTDPDVPLRVTVILSDFDTADRAAFPDEIDANDGTLTIVLECELDSVDPDQKAVRRWFPYGGHDRGPTRDQLETIAFAYVPAVRSLLRELGGSSTGAMRSLLAGLDLSADADELAAAADQYRAVLDGSEALRGLRLELAEALARALPIPVSEEDVRVATEAEILGDPLTGVTVTVREGDRHIPLAEQSDGIRALSVLTLLGLSHRSARIIGVDEPETHLHPAAQRSIARSLRAGEGQLVLVTHSAHVVAEMDPLDIVAFRADGNVRQLPEDCAFADVDAVRRHWSAQLIEPLTARRVMLVEGVSDRILVRRVSELLGIDLDRAGVVVLELDGAGSFPAAYGLLGPEGFDVPMVGICDEDARETWAEAVGVEPAELEGAGYVVCDPDLEEAYIDRLGVDVVVEMLLSGGPDAKRSLLRSCAVDDTTDVSRHALVEYCRSRKHKVRSALAIARSMDSGHATALEELCAVLGLAV